MRIRLVEPIEAAPTVTHNHSKVRVALEHVAVPQELRRQVLFGVETELIVVWYHPEAPVQRVRAMHDDRNAPLLTLFIQRIPVCLVHAWGGASPARVRTGIRGDEAEIFYAPLQLAEYVG